MNSTSLKIVVCVCTYRRPEGLQKLLLTLPSLEGISTLEVVVADNDSAKEGIEVCQSVGSDYPFTIHTVSETQPGISSARNSATQKALELNPDLVAFLDDDEWPEPQWLSELLRVQSTHDAAAVGGPTKSVFPENTAVEFLSSPYYGADMHLPDGSKCQLQAGGNFLMKADVLRTMEPEFFRTEFAHSGGEDLAFFTQLAHAGHSMYWASNAIVHEPVPESRLNQAWLRQRVVTIHNSRVRVMQLLEPSVSSSLIRCTKTVGLGVVAYSLSLLGCLSPALAEKARQLRWKFEGKLSAHIGRVSLRSETY